MYWYKMKDLRSFLNFVSLLGKSRLKYRIICTLFPRSEERVVERLSDDRVSPNEAILPLACGDYSPRLRYAGRPSLRLRRKEGKQLNKMKDLRSFLNFVSLLMVGLLLFLPSCKPEVAETGSAAKYFDLQGYFHGDAEQLTKSNPFVTKTVTHNGITETKKIHIADWGAELSMFIGSDINKPAWKDSYNVQDTGDALIYTAIDPNLKTREIIVNRSNDEVKWIMIINHTKNMLYETKEKLTYFPDSLYLIEKLQIVKLLGKNRYDIKGKLN
jgi:hypothetical protein